MSELNGTLAISIPSLTFNYVDNKLESIGTGGELYYRERGAYAPYAGTRWHELFGTPERAARTIWNMQMVTDLMGCCDADTCHAAFDECWKRDSCPMDDYDVLLEWLRGDAE